MNGFFAPHRFHWTTTFKFEVSIGAFPCEVLNLSYYIGGGTGGIHVLIGSFHWSLIGFYWTVFF